MERLAATLQMIVCATLGRARLLVVLMLALQVSGVAHAAADIVLSPEEALLHFTEDDGTDCAPGCPSCHHANGGIGDVPSPSTPLADGARVERVVVSPTPYIASAPLGPEVPSVYRPPRFS